MLCDGGGGEHMACAGQWALGSHGGGGEHIAQRSSRPAASHGGGGEQILPRWRWRALGSWDLHQSLGESTVAVESMLLAGILERQDFTVAVESTPTDAIPFTRIPRWRWRVLSTVPLMLVVEGPKS